MSGKTERAIVRGILLAFVASGCLSATAPASFPGHNGRIAYSAVRAGDVEIFTVQPDGGAPTYLTDDDDVEIAQDPAWSPDGSRIAYISRPDDDEQGSVMVMNEDGSGDITVVESALAPREPSWSPDGTRIAWTDLEPGVGEAPDVPAIFVKTIGDEGSPPPLVTRRFDSTISAVAWSPDGQFIAFVWRHPCDDELCVGWEADLMVVAAAGGAPTTLDGMDGLSADERGDVAWSPDGTRLAVSLRSRDLRIVSAGSGQTLVTVMSVSDEFPPFTSDSGRHLAWSPDGSQLTFVGAFADGSNEGNGLLVVTASGGDAREVPGVEVSEGGIDWQPLQAPVTTITTAPAAVTTARDARFEFIASKRPATFECRLDEQPWTACATGVDYAGLTLGPHVFRVRAESRGIAEERPPEYIWRVESSPQPGPRPDQPFPERTAIRARWYRYVFPRHMVEFRSLRAVRVPAGATIDVRCEGPGCPRGFHRQWRTRRFRVSRPILKGLDGRRLVRRAAVFVTITKPGYVGMGKMYCVRYNRRVRVRPYTLDRRQPKCGPTAAVERRSVLPP